MEKLWSKTKIGKMELPHRLAMAPMTRSRAQEDGTPGELSFPLLRSTRIYGTYYYRRCATF